MCVYRKHHSSHIMDEAFVTYCVRRRCSVDRANADAGLTRNPERESYPYFHSWFWARLAIQTTPPIPRHPKPCVLQDILEARCKVVDDECDAMSYGSIGFPCKSFADDIYDELHKYCDPAWI
jgi:hypothetical protein